MAIPLRASAGPSSRNATQLSAPSGSPWVNASAAAVIIESIKTPSIVAGINQNATHIYNEARLLQAKQADLHQRLKNKAVICEFLKDFLI